MGAKAQSIEVVYEKDNSRYELDLKREYDEIDLEFVNKWIGVSIKPEEVTKYLNMMQYDVQSIEGTKVRIAIPPYRNDVWHIVDIADDIARAYGYNNIKPNFPSVSSVGEHLPISQFRESFSECLVRLGYLETYTYMLTSTTTQFKKMDLKEDEYEFISLKNTAEQGINMVRLLILPESFETLHINRKNKYPQKIFENGFTIQIDDKSDTGASNEAHLCISIADPKSNYTQIKGVLDTLFKLHEINYEIRESDVPFLIEGRRADILVKGKVVGFIGEVAPHILNNFGLLVPVSSLELNLEKIFSLTQKDGD
jgi:phenylalanyl-tRNA synthetase beta chain